MTRSKKAAKRKHEGPPDEQPSGSTRRREQVSDDLKRFLIKTIVEFYEGESTMSLHNKYVRYNEECATKFKMDMWQRLMDVVNSGNWKEETDKSGFNRFLENRVHDSLWNAKDILVKFGKEYRAGDEEFQQVILRTELFVGRCAPFAKNKNRQGSIGWWKTAAGIEQDGRSRQHLIALPDTARVLHQDNKEMKGGYATIRRVRIEGCPGILPHWEFAAKVSNQNRTQPEVAKVEHQNESMAVRIGHAGVIRFAAVHATRNEGYAYWWNGGTLRHMLNLDNNYPEDIATRLLHSKPTETEVVDAFRLRRFRKKRTALAWAFLHIMRAVHDAGHLHNDLSPDNIMFHFPEDESRVYIGVCDWGMTTVAAQPPKSLYVFTKAADMTEALRRRWWVDPKISYLHKRDADVEIIPYLSRASEEYAVCKIAQRINNNSMSEEYWKLNMESRTMGRFSHHELATAFRLYLERVCKEGSESAGGLAHIINSFSGNFNWPMPDEHFRHSYE